MMKKTTLAIGLLAASLVACSAKTTTSSAPSSSGDLGDAGSETPTDDGGTTPAGGSCSTARNQLLVPIDKVSQAQVSVVSTTGTTKTVYVEAAAGGQQGAAKNPRVYVNLSTGARVDVTDVSASTSTGWDLALKRTVIFTNSGDAGPGQGGGADALKSFDAVTTADGAKAKPEKFFDADCNPQTDPIGGPLTSFSDWYDYNQANNGVTPRDTTYVVKGGTGKLFKVKILSFTANPDGTTNRTATGYYLLQVAEP